MTKTQIKRAERAIRDEQDKRDAEERETRCLAKAKVLGFGFSSAYWADGKVEAWTQSRELAKSFGDAELFTPRDGSGSWWIVPVEV